MSKKNNENVITRIGEEFSKELEEIKKIRIEEGIDKKKKSLRALTNLIITHEGWAKIKEDIIKWKF